MWVGVAMRYGDRVDWPSTHRFSHPVTTTPGASSVAKRAWLLLIRSAPDKVDINTR